MNRHDAIERVAFPSDPAPDAYRLLATCRLDPSRAPNGREPAADDAPPRCASDAPRGSVYLPRFRFRSRQRRRRPAPPRAD